MIFDRFLKRARNYGIRRILTDDDIKLSIIIWLLISSFSLSCLPFINRKCITFYSSQFLARASQIAVSLTALILVGLSILVAFTSEEFLSELKKIEVYENIMFVFEYTFYLTFITGILGAVFSSFNVGLYLYYVYLFLFIYMVLAIMSLIQLVVEFGNKKAKYELGNENKSELD